MSSQPIKPPSGYVFYFAYGSNMAAATMVRRQFHPEKSVVCELPNYAISFNMFAIPYVELSISSPTMKIGNGHKDLAYNVETVTVNALDSSESYEAVVLVTPREMTSSDHWPSRRYLDLCISGAVEQGLPPKYVEWMKNQPCYDPANKTTLQRVGSYAFGICFIPITMLLFFPTTYLAKNEIQAPALLPMCVLGVARLGRGAHNYGFTHVFGSGTNHE
ncbi:hypothetical protein CcCBS67573_g10084 [Chytriomyces confervae]|uniref:gamma-glutamylcyclotransferase n=1 Tax=Chytriomyces confervae TaxID=246404 RepID=A0A507DG75_9FUNG|nr:hypothetical protein CcCBS67573_g10084 [Chytriomyces confervae]